MSEFNENFEPIFKEKDKDNQFFYRNGKWVKCGEDQISSMWFSWSVKKGATRLRDKEGYLVFGILRK